MAPCHQPRSMGLESKRESSSARMSIRREAENVTEKSGGWRPSDRGVACERQGRSYVHMVFSNVSGLSRERETTCVISLLA